MHGKNTFEASFFLKRLLSFKTQFKIEFLLLALNYISAWITSNSVAFMQNSWHKFAQLLYSYMLASAKIGDQKLYIDFEIQKDLQGVAIKTFQ